MLLILAGIAVLLVMVVLLPWVTAAALVCLIAGLIWGFFLTPDADKFGSTVKIEPLNLIG